MLTVPLQPVPAQQIAVTLSGQPCTIKVYQKRTGLYFDLAVQNAPVVSGVIALNANRLVRYAYLGFIGDLGFFDTQGDQDPDYTGLGGRFALIYLEPADLAAAA